MSDIDDFEDRAKKERSPSYPFISLARAIERVQAFSEAHRRSPTRLAAVADTWRYAQSSSGLLQTISALRAFGLLEDIGKGTDRKIQLTDLAQRILHDERPGARGAAVREAALRPKLFAEYAEKWLPSRPSDSHCLSELRLDRGFTEAAAKMFLKSFDETFDFADLGPRDGLSGSSPSNLKDESEVSAVDVPPMGALVRVGPAQYATGPTGPSGPSSLPFGSTGPTGPTGPSGPQSRPAAYQSPRATLPLPEGIAALEIPSGLSRKSFEALKSWTEMMVSLAEKSVSSKWYVEWYTPKSTKAEEHYLLPDWSAVKEFMAEFKQAVPGVIFRVIAPDDAPAGDLAELRAAGVRTF